MSTFDRRFAICSAVALVLLASACGKQEQERSVHASEFTDWPLTVESGTLQCKETPYGEAVRIVVDGVGYGLNGTAIDHFEAQRLHAIWRDNPEAPGLKVSADSLLDEGRKLCRR